MRVKENITRIVDYIVYINHNSYPEGFFEDLPSAMKCVKKLNKNGYSAKLRLHTQYIEDSIYEISE